VVPEAWVLFAIARCCCVVCVCVCVCVYVCLSRRRGRQCICLGPPGCVECLRCVCVFVFACVCETDCEDFMLNEQRLVQKIISPVQILFVCEL